MRTQLLNAMACAAVVRLPARDQGHLVLGGQRQPFLLAGAPGQTWPRPNQPKPVRQLPLPRLITTPMQNGKTYVAQRPARIISRARIHGARALILLVAGYPQDGLLSSHVIVVWNRAHRGYFLSPHFGVSPKGTPYPRAQRIATALAITRRTTPER